MKTVIRSDITDALKEDFEDIGIAFEKAYTVNSQRLGETEIKLMKQRELVDFAVEWIEKERL